MYKIKRLINSSDISYKNEIRLTNLINHIQDVEALHIDDIHKLKEATLKDNFAIMLNFRHVNILRWPKFKETIKLITYPYLTKGFFGYRNTLIYDEQNNLIVESYSFGSFISLDTYKPIRINNEIIKAINDQEKHKMDYYGRKIEVPDNLLLLKTSTAKTLQTQIDYYNHLNNAFYIDIALNELPNNYSYSKVFAEHLNSFMVNDLIVIKTYKIENGYLIFLENENNEVYAKVMFLS